MTKTTSPDRLPSSIKDENLEVKWDHVADMAQMDSGERIVLKLRLSGLERDLALAACYTDEDRKLLQAAWKRFDRHKDLFKQVLMSGKSVPTQRRQAGQNQPVKPAPAPAGRFAATHHAARRAFERDAGESRQPGNHPIASAKLRHKMTLQARRPSWKWFSSSFPGRHENLFQKTRSRKEMSAP